MNRTALALVVSLLAAPSLVQADVNYTHRYIEPGQALSRTPETRVFFKPGARLVEEWRFHSGNFLREQRLTLFAEKKEVVMDMLLKIYKVVPLGTPEVINDDTAAVTIKELEEETILGLKARHYQIDIKYDYKDASPDADREVRKEVWVVPATTLKAYPTDLVPPEVGERIAGDSKALAEAMQGLVIRTRVSTPVKGNPQQYREVYSEEVSSLNTRELDDSYFKVPGDFKEVTAEEYAKAQMLLVEKWILADVG